MGDRVDGGYRRVLLKLGGEMFGGGSIGVDPDVVHSVARQIAAVARTGVQVAVVITMGQVAEPYIPRRAERHLEKGRVVIFGAGVGMPYFSTDTAAAQRALELGCEAVLMAKAVDGVYTADPKIDPSATMFHEISHREVLERGLKVADATAFSLCMDNNMPIIVFNLLTEGNIARAVSGERIGTLVSTPADGVSA
jgi:uridylate kinase